jgi:DNA-binding MarR family transcriptional regulator
MKLSEILGYEIDVTRHVALRSLRRILADCPINATFLSAMLLVRDQPGCDQTMLGRALVGNRSLGMKVASLLEGKGLMTRGPGRNRRTKGLYITAAGERTLTETLRHHARAEAILAAYLGPGERDMLLLLLAKVQRAVRDAETDALAQPAFPLAPGPMAQIGRS